MGGEPSASQVRASACPLPLRARRSRIRQDLNGAAVAQPVVQQVEQDIQATEPPGFAQFAKGRQIANVAFPAQFRLDGEPPVRLLEDEAIVDPPVADQLLQLRYRDRFLHHACHNAPAVDRDRRAAIDLAHPIAACAAVRLLLHLPPRPHHSLPRFAGEAGAAGQATVPHASVPFMGPCIAHAGMRFKLATNEGCLLLVAVAPPEAGLKGRRL